MKQLFANGDSHTIGTYTDNDNMVIHLERPFAKQLADRLELSYTNLALAGGSNNRIIRTTIDALPGLDPAETFILIGWSTCDRTEWYWDDKWHAICGDPGYEIPEFAKRRWQQNIDFVNKWQTDNDEAVNHAYWAKSKEHEHAIWVFHHLLNNLGYKFLFFNACPVQPFIHNSNDNTETKLPWIPGTWAHDPYEATGFADFCLGLGHQPDIWHHFSETAHTEFTNYLMPYVKLKLR